MLALHDNSTIYSQPKLAGWATLPSGDKVSPAQAGWTNGTHTISEVIETPQPQFDPNTQTMSSSIQIVGGAPTKVWAITDLTADVVEIRRIKVIKEGCSARIYAEAGDEEDQRNQSATFNVLNRMEANGTITAEGLTELDRLERLVNWVNEMRGACKQSIINGVTVSDVVWPSL